MTLEEFRKEWFGDSPTVHAHTSGSTGKPKPVELLKSDMTASAQATVDYFGLNEDSIFVCPLSLDYIAGKMMAVRAWLCGTEPVMVAPSNSPQLPPRADLLAVVVSQIPAVLESVRTGKCRVGNLLVGGSALPSEMAAAISETVPSLSAFESYGMTETCSHVALRRVGGDGLFHAMKHITFDTDSRNCLKVSLDNFSIKSIQTNDVVDLVSPTSFRWKGRFDNVINTGALKVFPEEVEAEILALNCLCSPFYISSEPDTKWGERVVMVAERPQAGSAFEDIDTLRAWLRNRIPAHHIPRRIIFVESLPRTYNGKIRRLKPDALRP